MAQTPAPPSKLVANLKAGKAQTVVAYGTSLSAGGGWVKQVPDALAKLFPGKITMVNSGGSGQYSKWGVDNLDKMVLEKKPDAVFIEFGVNDAVARFKLPLAGAKANLESMVDRILKQNPECEIILMTMTPADAYPKGHGSYRENIGDVYQMYRDVAKARKLLLVDNYANWLALQKSDRATFDRYIPDSVHPNAEGCAKIVTPAILKTLGVTVAAKAQP